jgi:hypothetical protein
LVPFTADFADGDEDGFFAFNGMLLLRGPRGWWANEDRNGMKDC